MPARTMALKMSPEFAQGSDFRAGVYSFPIGSALMMLSMMHFFFSFRAVVRVGHFTLQHVPRDTS